MNTLIYGVITALTVTIGYMSWPIEAFAQEDLRRYLIDKCIGGGGIPTQGGYGCIYPRPDWRRGDMPLPPQCGRYEHPCGNYCCPNRY